MAIRTILLHAAPDGGFDDRLAYAVRLASQTGAALKALYTLYPAGIPRVGRALSIYINEIRQEAKEKEAGIKARFEQAAAEAGVATSWETVEGDVTATLKDAARFSDLAIVSETPNGTVDDQLATIMPELLPLASDGPVIVVPTGKPVPASVGRILVAWKPSREAGHAVRFALPLLIAAEKVEILTVGEEGLPSASGAAITAYLTGHGVKAEHRHVDGVEATQAIASEASSFGADLIVLGAYSRSRFAEFILGGVTRSLLANPPAALFLAH